MEMTLQEQLQAKRDSERQALMELSFRVTCLDQALESLKKDDVEWERLERKSTDLTHTIMYAPEFRNELPTPETIGAETYKALKDLSWRGPVSIDTITKYVQKKFPNVNPKSVSSFLQVYQNDRRRPRNIRKVRPGHYQLEVKGPRRLLIEGKAPREVVQDTLIAAIEGNMPRGKELKGKKAPVYKATSIAGRIVKLLQSEHRVFTLPEIKEAMARQYGKPLSAGSVSFLYQDHKYAGCPFKKTGTSQWAQKGLRGVAPERNGNGKHGAA